jgi:hypothetical protein
MNKNVKNYLLIRYEDLRDNYDLVLSFFEKKFNLIKRNKDISEYIKINNYKGINNKIYFRKEIKLSIRHINLIKNNLDKKQENEIGYII